MLASTHCSLERKSIIYRIPDEYTVTGTQMNIFSHYGMTAHGLTLAAKTLLKSTVSST